MKRADKKLKHFNSQSSCCCRVLYLLLLFFGTFSLFGVVGAFGRGGVWHCAAQKEVVKIKHNTHLQLSGKAAKKNTQKIKQNSSTAQKKTATKTTEKRRKITTRKFVVAEECGRACSVPESRGGSQRTAPPLLCGMPKFVRY